MCLGTKYRSGISSFGVKFATIVSPHPGIVSPGEGHGENRFTNNILEQKEKEPSNPVTLAVR